MEMYVNYGDSPKYAEPLYSWPQYSLIGGVISGILGLISEIGKTLRIVSESDKGTFRLVSDINKGSLNVISTINVK